MTRQNLFTLVVVASSLLTAPAIYASPVSISSPVHAMFGKSKTNSVKFNLRNDTAASLEVLIGDKPMTLEPGKLVNVDVPVGTHIVANSATPNHAVGSLIEEVIKEHSGATIAIR